MLALPVLKKCGSLEGGGTTKGKTFFVLFSAVSPEIEGGGRVREKDRERNSRKALAHNVLLIVGKKTKAEATGRMNEFALSSTLFIQIYFYEFTHVKKLSESSTIQKGMSHSITEMFKCHFS